MLLSVTSSLWDVVFLAAAVNTHPGKGPRSENHEKIDVGQNARGVAFKD